MSEHGTTTDGRKKPTSFSELYPGRFLHSDHLKGKKVTLTIADVSQELLEGERGKEPKGIVAFRETPLLLVFSKINGTCLLKMFGNNPQQWVGKRITIYPTNKIMPMPTQKKANGEYEDCIRVYGSPDIDRDVEVVFAPPRRKKITMTMHRTDAKARSDQQTATPAPAPKPDAPPPADAPPFPDDDGFGDGRM